MSSNAAASDGERGRCFLRSHKGPDSCQAPPVEPPAAKAGLKPPGKAEGNSTRWAKPKHQRKMEKPSNLKSLIGEDRKRTECVLIIGAGSDLGQAVTRSCLEKGFQVKALLSREESVVRFCEEVRNSITKSPITGLKSEAASTRGRLGSTAKRLLQMIEPPSRSLVSPGAEDSRLLDGRFDLDAQLDQDEFKIERRNKEKALRIFSPGNQELYSVPFTNFARRGSSPAIYRIGWYDLALPTSLTKLFRGSPHVCSVVDCTLSDPSFGGVLPEGADPFSVSWGLDRYWRGKISLLEAARVSGTRGWVSFLPHRKKLWLTPDTKSSLVEDAFGFEVSSTGLEHVVFQLPRLFESACRWCLWSKYFLGFLSSGVGYLVYRVDSLCAWDVFVNSATASGTASSLSAELAISRGSPVVLSGCLRNSTRRAIERHSGLAVEKGHDLTPIHYLSFRLCEPVDGRVEFVDRRTQMKTNPLDNTSTCSRLLLRVAGKLKRLPRPLAQRRAKAVWRGIPRTLQGARILARLVMLGFPPVNRVISSYPGTGASWEFLSTSHRYSDLPEYYRLTPTGGLNAPTTLLRGASRIWRSFYRTLISARVGLPIRVSELASKLWSAVRERAAFVFSLVPEPYPAGSVTIGRSVILSVRSVFKRVTRSRKGPLYLAHLDNELPKLVELLGGYVFLFGRLFSRKDRGPLPRSMRAAPKVGIAGDLWTGAKVKGCRNLLSEVFERQPERALLVESESEYLMDLSRRKGVFKRSLVGTLPYYRLVDLMMTEEVLLGRNRNRGRKVRPAEGYVLKGCKEVVDWESLSWSLFVFGACVEGRGKPSIPGVLKEVGDCLWFYGASFMPSWFGSGLLCPPYGSYVGVYGGFYDVIVFVLGLFEGWSFVEELFGLRLREKLRGV